jgi:hypothetical protein
MAEQYDNEKRGCLFRNDKRGNDKAPDYRGTAEIEGKTWDLSGWVREIKGGKMAGQKMLSLAFQEPYEQRQGQDTTAGEGEGNMPF